MLSAARHRRAQGGAPKGFIVRTRRSLPSAEPICGLSNLQSVFALGCNNGAALLHSHVDADVLLICCQAASTWQLALYCDIATIRNVDWRLITDVFAARDESSRDKESEGPNSELR